jgi:hypothetical protein
MTRPPNDRGPAKLVQLIAIELATLPPRINRALEVLADARSPLRANSYEALASGGGGPDPGQTALAAQADHDRRNLIRAIRDLDTQSRTIRTILDEWAPQQLRGDLAMWCENCSKYGISEPRALDGSRCCRWCNDVHRAYNCWPTGKLAALHARGRRITEDEYRRLLGKGAA